jgi:hypothetical protein
VKRTETLKSIINYLSLISYTAQSWPKDGGSQYPNTAIDKRRPWINDLTGLIATISPTSHQITSTLSLLSASVKQGSALPPYIQVPQSYNLSRRLEALENGILDSRHVEEPGYSAYAVMQVASSLLTDDLARLVDHVKDLVGETDFSFLVNDSSVDSGGSEGGLGKGKQD